VTIQDAPAQQPLAADAADRLDAARYRWLRNTHTWNAVIWEAIHTGPDDDYQTALDRAVDAAIAKEESESRNDRTS